MNISRHIVRNISTGILRQAQSAPIKGDIPKGYFELKKIQEHFQKKDGKPVFLKGGPMDNVLYGTTVVLCFVGLGGMFKLFYELSNPKPSE